jgi:hypothetical protein
MLAYSFGVVTIKSVLSAMTNYAMFSMSVHLTCLDYAEKSCRNFLWHGKDINKSGNCLVQREKVCLPKSAGGLGILSLRDQNNALMMKNLYEFYNGKDIPWVQCR